MKRKMTIIAMMLVGVMITASFTGCGIKTAATDANISEENLNKTVNTDEETIIITDENSIVGEEVIVNGTETNDQNERAGFKGNEDIVIYEESQGVSEEVDRSNLTINQGTPALDKDITDGNIVLYGGEKKPVKYGGISQGVGEEVNIVLENVEDDVPLYSGEGRLCGYLKAGGSIVVTEHCSVMTAWYRFKNPIEGTGYDYLYVQRFETVMSNDRKAYIEEEMLIVNIRTKFLDAPEADMECYEFSVPREKYSNDINFLYSDEFDSTQYKTFYIECTRNGDFFDYKVYYK